MDEEPVSAMAEFLADLGSVATAVWDQVTTAAETRHRSYSSTFTV